jgi:hypothetical protein
VSDTTWKKEILHKGRGGGEEMEKSIVKKPLILFHSLAHDGQPDMAIKVNFQSIKVITIISFFFHVMLACCVWTNDMFSSSQINTHALTHTKCCLFSWLTTHIIYVVICCMWKERKGRENICHVEQFNPPTK